jgi:hypothetical protein
LPQPKIINLVVLHTGRSVLTIQLQQCMNLCTKPLLIQNTKYNKPFHPPTPTPNGRLPFCLIDCDSLKPPRLLVCARLTPAILIVVTGASVTVSFHVTASVTHFICVLRRLPFKFAVRVVLTCTFHSTLHNL